ncbi:MAG: DUF6152 family protein [Steroidobacteraceae bacterium]
MKINATRRVGIALAVAALCGAGPARTHHSTAAEFDSSKPVTFTGTVQKVMWTNPHIYTHVEVKRQGAPSIVYHIEGNSPNALFRQGWRKDSIKVGEVVTVTGRGAKNPDSPNIGQATMVAADGRKVFSGEGPAKARPE